MKLRFAVLFSCGALLLAPALLSAQVRGRIIAEESGDAIAGALVQITGTHSRIASSGADGAYQFADLQPGDYCLQVQHPAYTSPRTCISLGAAGTLILDLPMSVRPMVLPPLVITSHNELAHTVARTARGEPVRSNDVRLLGDLAGRALAAPLTSEMGRNSARNPLGGAERHELYLWGSTMEQGRVLLDGASLNAPLHLGALLPPLDPAVLASATLRAGGASPRYDGGAGYIVEYTTRTPTQQSGVWGEMDLLTARAGGEVALGEHSHVLASVRRVNDEMISSLVSPHFGYGYSDAFARADMRVSDNSRLHVTAFGSGESIRIPRDVSEDQASWLNRAAMLEWRSERDTEQRSALLSFSRGAADLPLLSAVGGHMVAGVDRASGMLDRTWTTALGKWDVGGEVEHLRFSRRASADASGSAMDSPSPYSEFGFGGAPGQDPATNGAPIPVSCTKSLPCVHASTTLGSAFGQLTLNPAGAISAALGLRTTYDAASARFSVLPRASLTLFPGASYPITLSVGRFSQALTRDSSDAGVASVAANDQRLDLFIAHATHVQLGIRHEGSRAFLNGNAYLHFFEAGYPGGARTIPGSDFTVGYRGRAGTVSLGYSVSDAGEDFVGDTISDAGIEQIVALNFDGTFRVLRFDATATYGTGLPLTSIVLEQRPDINTIKQPVSTDPVGTYQPMRNGRNFLRLDATIGAELGMRIGARRMRLMPYVRIINALSQRDALFYFQDPKNVGSTPQPLAQLPAVPTLGFKWFF